MLRVDREDKAWNHGSSRERGRPYQQPEAANGQHSSANALQHHERKLVATMNHELRFC